MADSTNKTDDATPTLSVSTRAADGSRAARRMRRAGRVPGVMYGGGDDPVSFEADERELRHALAGSRALFELSVDGAKGIPVVLKDIQRHPVRGETLHVDLLRVRLDRPIHAVVALELQGTEGTTGVREGGILEQGTRELNVEALPAAIPESIVHEVQELQIGESLTLEAIAVPQGITLLDPPETVIATILAPRLQSEVETEIESETELVGESESPAQDGSSGEE